MRRLITTRDGSLWAASSLGPLRFRNGTWTLYTIPAVIASLKAPSALPIETRPLPDAVLAEAPAGRPPEQQIAMVDVVQGADGAIWLCNRDGEMLVWRETSPEDDTVSESWVRHGRADGVDPQGARWLLALREGPVWLVGGSSGRAWAFEGGSWRAIDLAAAGVPLDCAHPLQTRDGTIWLSSRYAVSALREGAWTTYRSSDTPIPSATNMLLQTSDGALWIAGPSTEILRIDYQTRRWQRLQDLNFHWESPAGVQWFIHRSGRVVRKEGDDWVSFGVEDGLLDTPVALHGTAAGEVWVAGSHEHTAATARFVGTQWIRQIHGTFSWGIEPRGVLESSDGSMWFAASVDSSGPKEHRAGILQYNSGTWVHHHQPGRGSTPDDDHDPATLLPATQRPEPIGKFLVLGESRDGRIWAGRNILIARDDRPAWSIVAPPEGLRFGIIEAMLSSREGDLWIGSRQFGALRYDGHAWHAIHHREGLMTNTVRALAQTSDGSIWAATDRDIARIDGTTWTPRVLPTRLTIPTDGGNLKPGHDGTIWINHADPGWMRRGWRKAAPVDTATCTYWTAGYTFAGRPPDTTILTRLSEVSQPGNLSVLWTGTDPWQPEGESSLQYSHRLDHGEWSPFSTETVQAFFTLPPGAHRLQVRARDRDYNVDPTPAVLEFTVLPPVWRTPWFVLLMAGLVGSVLAQSVRVIRERGRLRSANRELAAQIDERARARRGASGE